jgi:predicted secreted protein
MKWTSMLAIYALFWVLAAFVVMPFGIRTHDEAGFEKIRGQADSAPANFNPKLIAKRASVLALLFFALFYANYVNGWIMPQDFDFFGGDSNYDEAK